MGTRRTLQRFLCLAVAVSGIALWGCAPAIPIRTGEPLDESRINHIRRGETTKHEILESLGPPIAIAVRDETVTIQSPTLWIYGSLKRGGYYEIQSDTFFELFSWQHELNDYHRVYYYYSTLSKTVAFVMLLAVYARGWTDIDELWLLVNERTGVVEDYVLRMHR